MEILENPSKYDYNWTILLLGAHRVGKSAFRKRLQYKNYTEYMKVKNLNFCLDPDFILVYIKYLNRLFKLKIFDNYRHERLPFAHNYFNTNSINLIFYDAFNRESFNILNHISGRILSINEKRIIILVRSKYELNLKSTGNNIDIVSDEEVLEYLNNKNDNDNIFFFHLSSYEKYESGINNLLEFIIKISLKKYLRK